MIGLDELNEAKEKRKTNLYYEEKEYLQYIFLNAISKHPENFIFKGGTCLRICSGLERASEDLDFNTNLKILKIKEIVKQCLKDFDLLNIKNEIFSEKELAGNLRVEIRFEGPLFAGRKTSTNTIKIDFSNRKANTKEVKVVQKLFSDVPLFTIIVMEEKEMLAEKIRALLTRKKPRDLYDVWILLNKGAVVDKQLLLGKLKEDKMDSKKIVFPSKEDYERDLKILVKAVPDYEQVKNFVNDKIKELNL